MPAPVLYHVDQLGAFAGRTSFARRSPADQDEVWLIPEGATTVAPPPVGAGQVALLRGGQWSVIADFRGQLVYDKATLAARLVEEPGDIAESETLQAPPSAQHVWTGAAWRLPLGPAKAAKLRQVAAQLAQRQAAGFTWFGVVYQIDEASQGRIAALALKAERVVAGRAGATWNAGFRFLAADNSRVAFTAAEFGAFADAAANAVIALRERARDLKDEILAAANASELAAIDVTAGWP